MLQTDAQFPSIGSRKDIVVNPDTSWFDKTWKPGEFELIR
jgi:hypothetical protein